MFKFIPIVFVFLSFFSQAEELRFSAYVDAVDEKKLYQNEVWLGLLAYQHYDPRRSSDIVTSEFFLSELGRSDPRDELIETLRALFAKPSISDDEHAICNFPARKRWLKNILSIPDEHFPSVTCDRYSNWIESDVDSVSLIFATGFMSNPASFYGHMLFKFDSKKAGLRTELEDSAINFGAVIPENENMLMYIGKGLVGGYLSSFSTKEYYNFQHLYGNNDLRDIWHYELNLSSFELKLLQDHLFELLGKRYRYYFLSKNCAFRLAYILEFISGRKLLNHSASYVIPSEVFRELVNADNLVSDIYQTPSRQSLFYQKYEALNSDERGYLNEIVTTKSFLTPLPDDSKIKALETFFDYYEYKREADVTEEQIDLKRRALLERMKLEGKVEWPSKPARPPHKGDSASALQVGSVYSQGDAQLLINLRIAYYDRLSTPASNVEFAELIMGQAELRHSEEHGFFVDALNLVDITSLNIARTNLPGDGGLAWKLFLGANRFSNECTDCLRGVVRGGLGKARYDSLGNVLMARVDLSMFTQVDRSGHFGAHPNISYAGKLNDRFRYELGGSFDYLVDSERSSKASYFLKASYDISNDWDIRFEANEQRGSEIKFSVMGYW